MLIEELKSLIPLKLAMNKLFLVSVIIICWIVLITLGIYNTFRLENISGDLSDIMTRVNGNNTSALIADLSNLHTDIVSASQIEGMTSALVFSILCLSVFMYSLTHFKELNTRAHNFRDHKLFWIGVILDIIGLSYALNGFVEYTQKNPGPATIWTIVGMACVGLGSFMIIYRYENAADSQTLDYAQFRDQPALAQSINAEVRVPLDSTLTDL